MQIIGSIIHRFFKTQLVDTHIQSHIKQRIMIFNIKLNVELQV